MRIKKIILEDGSEKEFIPKIPKGINDQKTIDWQIRVQLITWEEEEILPNLLIDIEDYAKDEFDLIDADDKDDISVFDDDDILDEAENRGLYLNNASIQNENIINEDFLIRFAEIINRGNDNEIDEVLETLEKKYHIK